MKNLLNNVFYIRGLSGLKKSFSDSLNSLKRFVQNNRLNTNRMNLGNLFNSIKTIYLFIHNISKFISEFSVALLQSLKKILLLPSQIKLSIQKVKNEISKLWTVIEQIIQIVRLPIEILAAINRTILTIATFLQRLERPNFR